MEDNVFHTGDWGILFKFRAVERDSGQIINISSATNKYMLFRRPNGTAFFKEANFTTDGSDGYIQYITVEDDLDAVGEWLVQGYVVLPDSGLSLESYLFKVKSTIYTGSFDPPT